MECATCNGTGAMPLADENGELEMVPCWDCVRWTLTEISPEQSEAEPYHS